MKFKNVLFWHRRDIRIADNAGLHKALINSEQVAPVFIFDTAIIDKLPKNDARISFIHAEITALKEAYRSLNSDLIVAYGDPKIRIPELAKKYKVDAVFTNRDYEPYARSRDAYLLSKLKDQQISFIGAKDHVVFEKEEVLKADGLPYTAVSYTHLTLPTIE